MTKRPKKACPHVRLGEKRCSECKVKHAAFTRAKRSAREAQGFCTRCPNSTAKPAVSGGLLCGDCIEKNGALRIEKYKKHGWCTKGGEKHGPPAEGAWPSLAVAPGAGNDVRASTTDHYECWACLAKKRKVPAEHRDTYQSVYVNGSGVYGAGHAF